VSDRETQFGGLTIRYDERVLEPRQWTTCQARWAAELLRRTAPGPVLELCAGAGHIGLLTVSYAARDLVLVDADATACEYARGNVETNGPAVAVEVRHGRVDEVLAPHERFAGILADPPWVPSREVRRFPADPRTAIDGGSDGMDVAWSCLDVIARHLASDGWSILQLGTTLQAEAVRKHLEARPELHLEFVEMRLYDGQGVLVHLARGRSTR
jgi:release factor glutamine methyltransferase